MYVGHSSGDVFRQQEDGRRVVEICTSATAAVTSFVNNKNFSTRQKGVRKHVLKCKSLKKAPYKITSSNFFFSFSSVLKVYVPWPEPLSIVRNLVSHPERGTSLKLTGNRVRK
jgi:hypothetical protein